jgi:hypothetical protein
MAYMIRLTLMNLRAMEIKPIKTEKDYNHFLERLEIIFDSKTRFAEGDELEVNSY